MVKRTDRVGAIILLGSLVPGIIGLFLVLMAIEWFQVGLALLTQ